MLALPPAPQAPARRQVFVATSLAAAAGTTLLGGMLAMWLQFRADAPLRESAKRGMIKDWMPAKIVVPEVATNMMLIGLCVVCVMAQWAVYSAKRNDRTHAGLAFGLTALFGLMVVNAQVYTWTQMGVAVSGGAFHTMFYAITGTMMVLLVSGLVFTAVAAFRYLGGRTKELEVVSANALYWYFLTAAFTALWFVVYVQK
jgi:heme/copper-type cytochrome/quinol oxidase subunit 3